MCMSHAYVVAALFSFIKTTNTHTNNYINKTRGIKTVHNGSNTITKPNKNMTVTKTKKIIVVGIQKDKCIMAYTLIVV